MDEEKKGITPAYAGKSVYIALSCSIVEDHPRVCGEKFAVTFISSSSLGSPPRMRGKVLYVLVSGEPNEDHPRVCGEKTKKIP